MKDKVLKESVTTEGKCFSNIIIFFSYMKNIQVKERNVPKFSISL